MVTRIIKMKVKLILELSENDDIHYETECFLNRYKNSDIVNNIYDKVFRRVIKYSEDKKKVDIYEEVWEKVYRFINENN